MSQEQLNMDQQVESPLMFLQVYLLIQLDFLAIETLMDQKKGLTRELISTMDVYQLIIHVSDSSDTVTAKLT